VVVQYYYDYLLSFILPAYLVFDFYAFNLLASFEVHFGCQLYGLPNNVYCLMLWIEIMLWLRSTISATFYFPLVVKENFSVVCLNPSGLPSHIIRTLIKLVSWKDDV